MPPVPFPRPRLRQAAEILFQLRNRRVQSFFTQESSLSQARVKVVCISDTHNLCPTLPPGDLLIHAGDLSKWGSFDEIQAQLDWLSSQPHQHKILIAGNHDSLLDEDFLYQHPERRDRRGRTKHDLDFGSVTYLQDESVTLSFAGGKRVLRIYGSPWTLQWGVSAFQHPWYEDWWTGRVPASTDILVTHGPPARFNDVQRWAGCAYLRQEVARVKPRLMVFGHVHVARGEQTVTFDTAQWLYDDLMDGSRGQYAILLLALAMVWSCLRQLVGYPVQSTKMVNAAVVDKKKKGRTLDAFVVDL